MTQTNSEMCYNRVPVPGGANLQLTVVPPVHPLHRSASHIATIDVTILCSAQVYNIYLLSLSVCLISLSLALE